MTSLNDMIKRAKEAQVKSATQTKRRVIALYIPHAHANYIHAFTRIVAQIDTSITFQVIKGNIQNLDAITTKAKLANVEQVWIANVDVAKHLIQPHLGRARVVNIDDWAGSVFWLDKTIPALILPSLKDIYARRWTVKSFEHYIKKSKEIPAIEPEFKWYQLGNIADDSVILDAILKDAHLMAIDIETNRDNLITCIGFSILQGNGRPINYVIDLRKSITETKIKLIRKLCGSSVPKVFHNGTYDNQMLQQNAIVVRNWILDTEYLMYCMFEEMPRSLAFVAGLFVPHARFWKHTHDDDLLEYNARDCEQTLLACINMLQNYPQYAKKKYASVFSLTTPALYCALHGVKVEADELDSLAEQAHETVAPLELQLRKSVGLGLGYKQPEGMVEAETINPNSPKQLAWLLYDVIGGSLPNNSKKTDTKSLSKLANQHPLLEYFVDLIRRIRKENKAISTYFTAELRHSRLYYSYRIDGTESGRLSCSKSNFGNIGAQIQNVPFYMKSALVADDGYLIGECDKSQAEARITAYFADDETLINALEDLSKDFYLTCGELFFGIPYDQVSKDLRNKIIKRIIHGTNYMMQAQTFLDTVGIDALKEARKLLNMEHMRLVPFADYLLSLYHKAYPEVSKWHNATKLQLSTKGYLESPLGWRRYFFGDPSSPATLRSAVAHQPQNLNVHIVNRAFVQVFWRCVVPSNGAFCLIAQVHDSILFQAKQNKAKQYQQQVIQILEEEKVTFPSGKTMSIPVDGSLGNTWAEVK